MFPKYTAISEFLEYEIYKDLNADCTVEGKLQHKFNQFYVTYSITIKPTITTTTTTVKAGGKKEKGFRLLIFLTP